MTDLADIASELYSQPLDEFTAARNTRAKALDDKSLAKEVRALRKPSASTWLPTGSPRSTTAISFLESTSRVTSRCSCSPA